MENPDCFFSSFSLAEDQIPVPELLKNKDKRADIAARVAVQAATNAIQGISPIDLTSLNIVVVNREGCKNHLNKVSNSIKKNLPAQGFFVRGGPQTLATYPALALGAHGAAFTFVGDQKILKNAVTTACYLACNIKNGVSLLMVIVKKNMSGYQANTALALSNNHSFETVSSLFEQKIHHHLLQAFNTEIIQ